MERDPQAEADRETRVAQARARLARRRQELQDQRTIAADPALRDRLEELAGQVDALREGLANAIDASETEYEDELPPLPQRKRAHLRLVRDDQAG